MPPRIAHATDGSGHGSGPNPPRGRSQGSGPRPPLDASVHRGSDSGQGSRPKFLSGANMEALMVTDGIKIQTTTELMNSDNYHAKAIEVGLVRHHMQGYLT